LGFLQKGEHMQHMKASELYRLAFEDLHNGRIEEGGRKFRTLLTLDSESYEFMYGMACYLGKIKDFGTALVLLKRAVALKKDFAPAINNIGYILYNQQKFDESRTFFYSAIKIDPKSAEAYINLAASYVAWGEPDKGIKYATKALELKPDDKQALNNLSLCHLEKGEYDTGFTLYDARSIVEGNEERNYSNDGTPQWDGVSPGTVVVYGEQGLGDEIMFGSCIPDILRNNNINFVLDCHPRLLNIWRHSFPGELIFGTRKENILCWTARVKPGFKVALPTLCKLFRKSESDFPKLPYLKPYDHLADVYNKKISSKKLKVGIAWKGGTPKTNLFFRHTNLEQWLPILKQDCDFYSFQYFNDAEKDIDEFKEQHPEIVIHHWRDEIDDYEKTVALASNMDVIISVPQSIVHVGGALGVKTWQLCPFRAMWQMGPYGKDLPWYSDTKSFWQDKSCNWSPVFEKAGEELCNLLAIHSEK